MQDLASPNNCKPQERDLSVSAVGGVDQVVIGHAEDMTDSGSIPESISNASLVRAMSETHFHTCFFDVCHCDGQ